MIVQCVVPCGSNTLAASMQLELKCHHIVIRSTAQNMMFFLKVV